MHHYSFHDDFQNTLTLLHLCGPFALVKTLFLRKMICFDLPAGWVSEKFVR